MFANTQLGCMSLGLMDVCNTIVGTATVPTPYVNIAMSSTAVPNAVTVLMSGGFAHNLLTIPTITSGDESGTALGVASGTMIGSCTHVTCSTNVFVGVSPATRLTDTTIQNSTNAVGTTLTPAQVTCLILS